MSLKEDLETRVREIFKQSWTARDGIVVPSDDSIKLNNDAVKLEATVLYADLADSTKLVDGYQDWFAAEIYKTFLHCAAKIITSEGGTITAYDGDRIMAVFIGDLKNTTAVRTALKINWAAKNIVQKEMKDHYMDRSNYELFHVCGVDTSDIFVAKTGIRGANDLVWVGKAPNYAAKLAALDHNMATWITGAVYDKMHTSAKTARDGSHMWVKNTWNAMGGKTIYSSTYWWEL